MDVVKGVQHTHHWLHLYDHLESDSDIINNYMEVISMVRGFPKVCILEGLYTPISLSETSKLEIVNSVQKAKDQAVASQS